MADKRMTSKRLESEFGITVDAEFVPYSKSRSFDPKVGSDVSKKNLNWKVTLRHNGRDVITTDYSAGIAHAPSYKNYNSMKHGSRFSVLHAGFLEHEVENGREAYEFAVNYRSKGSGKPILPDGADVVWSLVQDGSAIDSPTYEEWAAEYGYGEDSRKGEATYRACLEIGLKIRAALGEAQLTKLREEFQDV